ncbi:MAG: twin-arginine translocase TatA/TatE family subunit [Pelolinea sp.]|nr:twin-arginine translocase TatA/TatE family subunit [Pelolinea sp.]
MPSGWEIIVVLVIILLLFGPGRISKVAGEMGKSIKAFKDGLSENKQPEEDDSKESQIKGK